MFGQFDLGERTSYGAFLATHAAILPPVEAWLDRHQLSAGIAGWHAARRSHALLADCDTLAIPHPAHHPFDMAADAASVCGVTYVMEGSRLGGAFLSRGVAAGLPRAYLAAPQQTILWRAFLADLDRLLPDSAALHRAVEAALHTFAAFRIAGERATIA